MNKKELERRIEKIENESEFKNQIIIVKLKTWGINTKRWDTKLQKIMPGYPADEDGYGWDYWLCVDTRENPTCELNELHQNERLRNSKYIRGLTVEEMFLVDEIGDEAFLKQLPS